MGETHDVGGIDATAGGSKDNDDEPSGCLDLDTEEVTPLTPAEAVESKVTEHLKGCAREAMSLAGRAA